MQVVASVSRLIRPPFILGLLAVSRFPRERPKKDALYPT